MNKREIFGFEKKREARKYYNLLLCPNFAGSEDAPTTAKYGEEKKVRAAASVAIFLSIKEYYCTYCGIYQKGYKEVETIYVVLYCAINSGPILDVAIPNRIPNNRRPYGPPTCLPTPPTNPPTLTILKWE